MEALSAELFEILACPRCKGAVEPSAASGGAIVCKACRLAYPIQDGIPVMLAEEAQPLPDAEDA